MVTGTVLVMSGADNRGLLLQKDTLPISNAILGNEKNKATFK